MGEKIVVGPINKGLRTDREPFAIDDDSFPTLINAYQWRGRIKRKRGTSFLNRLKRYFDSTSTAYNSGSTTITLNGSGEGNLITGFSLETDANITPGNVTITAPGPTEYTDPDMDGTLSPSGSINYATGAITILAEAGSAVSVTMTYFPSLPVMGLEEFSLEMMSFPGMIAFDTVYAYNISTSNPYNINNVSFYKNLPTGTYSGYVQKTTWTPLSWNGEDYQQFFSTNYQGALWVTNGITVPFNSTNIGMPFQNASATVGAPTTSVTFTMSGGSTNLVVGDFVFANEFTATGDNAATLNFQTGYVTAVAGVMVTVTFPNASIAADTYSNGLLQFLTNRSDITKDCIRWYDGDPTDGNANNPTFIASKGWVNFCPPLSQRTFSVAEAPIGQYYLVGARMIVPFKDRLLFFGPVIQTSTESPIYLQDTVIYSQNGTPYYTSSFTGDPELADTVFTPILVPTNQSANASAYFEDQSGFGGFISAGVDQPINSVASNEDVLITGFSTLQARLVYQGNDLIPFYFYQINSELGSSSTFSAINMDQGVMTRGSRGYITTSQNGVSRIDIPIPDQVFQVDLTNNGNERFTAQRDFINEWIYFTYPSNQETWKFPNQTLQYNYRDDSWAIFNESYTTYGTFRKQTGFTWATVGDVFPTWEQWNEAWNAGSSTLLQPTVIAGNQQGFICIRDDGTGEGESLFIKSIAAGVITSPNHTLSTGDFIIIKDVLGTVGPDVNNNIYSIVAIDDNTFSLLPPLSSAGTYLGGGVIVRMYIPFIQTKQFPTSWSMGRKTRIGVQKYLLSTTPNSQITLNIYLSMDNDTPYNFGPIVPAVNTYNNALIYSSILYTCPESTNLGLTPANTNLQMPTATQQQQIWHRKNTSLIGDTIQLGFTLSEDQMRSFSDNIFPITGASQANPCVLTTSAFFAINTEVTISGVEGMTELNGNTYTILDSSSTTLTIDVDSTLFTAYESGGIGVQIAPVNQFAEIELHAFILEVTPSQQLA